MSRYKVGTLFCTHPKQYYLILQHCPQNIKFPTNEQIIRVFDFSSNRISYFYIKTIKRMIDSQKGK